MALGGNITESPTLTGSASALICDPTNTTVPWLVISSALSGTTIPLKRTFSFFGGFCKRIFVGRIFFSVSSIFLLILFVQKY